MNKLLQVAICDDEKRAISIITGAVNSILNEENVEFEVTSFTTPSDLLNSMKTKRFDLLLLDISMPEMDGVAFGKRITDMGIAPDIIFVSSNMDRVFDTFAIKPFAFVRKTNFIEDMNDALHRYVTQKSDGADGKDIIQFKVQQDIVPVKASRIKYIECFKNVQNVYVDQEEEAIIIHSRMEALEEELVPYGMMRVHKGYLVNCAYIKKIESKRILLLTGEELPVGRSFQPSVKSTYISYLGNR